MYHTLLFLNLSKIFTSINCATRKAVPDPMAILIDIRSEKFVEINNVIMQHLSQNPNKQYFLRFFSHSFY